jgi:hypothetical protein
MARAAGRGLSVTRPHGDSASYDVGIEHNGRYVRVQVKSTTFERKGSYTCNIISKTGVHYAEGKLDIFAVYLVPIDLWYIIPFQVAARNKSLNLTPYDGHKFAQYIEAWHLLRSDEGRSTMWRGPRGSYPAPKTMVCIRARLQSCRNCPLSNDCHPEPARECGRVRDLTSDGAIHGVNDNQ